MAVSSGMLDIVIALIDTLASALGSRKDLALENLALRQQLAVAKRHRFYWQGAVGRSLRVTNVERTAFTSL